MRTYLELAGLALALLFGWFAYVKGGEHKANEIAAEAAKRKDTVQTAIDLRDQTATTARVDMLDYLRVTIPPIEIRTHETVERVRIAYRDRPVAGECVRPIGVQADLDAARERANAAIGAM